jgi:hypothetical protein
MRPVRLPLATLAALLLTGGLALAIGTGLQNPSFENDLDHWTSKTLDDNENRDVVYGPGGSKDGLVPGCAAPDAYNICVVSGPDTFNVTDDDGTRPITVSPLDGSKMLRLAGPFHDDTERQETEDVFNVAQTFTVDPANSVLRLNYNLFTFDYTGFDELRLVVRITDEQGEPVSRFIRGGFGEGGDTNLKTTGWRSANIDLSGFGNQQMHVAVELQGTSDSLFGSWAYIDAGTAPTPPVSASGATGAAPSGVTVHKEVDGDNGLVYFGLGASQVNTYSSSHSGACMPFDVNLPINPGAGALSNVVLNFRDQHVGMTNVSGNIWHAQLCLTAFESGGLSLAYDLTEGLTTQHFLVSVGGMTLIDPQGVVFDTAQFSAAIAGGQTPVQALATAAIAGATVRLQRQNGSGGFDNVLSGDPGISPNVNPETTGSDGRFQWDVAAGIYRVSVTAPGHHSATSSAVAIPPPALDLNVGLAPIPPTPPPPPVTPVVPPPPPVATGKRVAALKKCKKKQGAKRKKCKKKASKLPV